MIPETTSFLKPFIAVAHGIFYKVDSLAVYEDMAFVSQALLNDG